jgi:hypothetical protein
MDVSLFYLSDPNHAERQAKRAELNATGRIL